MKYYKLTNIDNRTFNETEWGKNVTHKTISNGKRLCTSDVIHVYDSPLKAAMFNPIHANFSSPQLWECRVRKVVANDGLKVGVKKCTTIREVLLPKITIAQRVRFAIYCALEVYSEKSFVKWAHNWLSGKDCSTGATRAAEAEARAAAAWAAEAAGWAARAEARAADINFNRLIRKSLLKTAATVSKNQSSLSI